jgi:hypothetical protein
MFQIAVDQVAPVKVEAVFMSAVDFGVTPENEVVLKVVPSLDSTPDAGVGARVLSKKLAVAVTPDAFPAKPAWMPEKVIFVTVPSLNPLAAVSG